MKDGEEVEKREGAARMRERSDGQTGANIYPKWEVDFKAPRPRHEIRKNDRPNEEQMGMTLGMTVNVCATGMIGELCLAVNADAIIRIQIPG